MSELGGAGRGNSGERGRRNPVVVERLDGSQAKFNQPVEVTVGENGEYVITPGEQTAPLPPGVIVEGNTIYYPNAAGEQQSGALAINDGKVVIIPNGGSLGGDQHAIIQGKVMGRPEGGSTPPSPPPEYNVRNFKGENATVEFEGIEVNGDVHISSDGTIRFSDKGATDARPRSGQSGTGTTESTRRPSGAPGGATDSAPGTTTYEAPTAPSQRQETTRPATPESGQRVDYPRPASSGSRPETSGPLYADTETQPRRELSRLGLLQHDDSLKVAMGQDPTDMGVMRRKDEANLDNMGLKLQKSSTEHRASTNGIIGIYEPKAFLDYVKQINQHPDLEQQGARMLQLIEQLKDEAAKTERGEKPIITIGNPEHTAKMYSSIEAQLCEAVLASPFATEEQKYKFAAILDQKHELDKTVPSSAEVSKRLLLKSGLGWAPKSHTHTDPKSFERAQEETRKARQRVPEIVVMASRIDDPRELERWARATTMTYIVRLVDRDPLAARQIAANTIAWLDIAAQGHIREARNRLHMPISDQEVTDHEFVEVLIYLIDCIRQIFTPDR